MSVIEIEVIAGRPPVVELTRDALPEVAGLVREHGAVLLRGPAVRDERDAAEVSRALLAAPLAERESFAPRTELPGGVYSSTHWPADQPMCAHHELSYARDVPSRLVFCCLTAPATGGATPLADAAAVLRDLPADLVHRFARDGWLLRRSHNDIVGVDWPDAFGTDDRSEVERYCLDNDISWTWEPGGGLRTRRRRPAVIDHPDTGERLWFNQIAFLNEWTMEPAVREYLALELGPDGLPYNTFHGDGTPLDKSTVDLINDVYAAHTIRVPWCDGDVMVVDNLRMAHGREPYQGERRIVVALGDPVRVG